jgi:tRNA threonylcarbamoyl adenosine modification protein YeaZ
MKILAFDFSSEERSVAICDSLNGAPAILGWASERGYRSTHAISLIETALASAKLTRDEIDCLALGIGPGSYTGIRAAIALAQGWQLATNIKTIGISSVECLAAQAQSANLLGRVHIVIDAQRNEFYCATYQITATDRAEVEKLQLVPAVDVEQRAKAGEIILGPDAKIFGGRELFPDAGAVAKLAALNNSFVPAEQLEPIYLREVNFVKAPPPLFTGNQT